MLFRKYVISNSYLFDENLWFGYDMHFGYGAPPSLLDFNHLKRLRFGGVSTPTAWT